MDTVRERHTTAYYAVLAKYTALNGTDSTLYGVYFCDGLTETGCGTEKRRRMWYRRLIPRRSIHCASLTGHYCGM